MLWAALLPQAETSPCTEALQGAAHWALQYTPRVAVLESSALALEVSGSTRLFGGRRALAQRIRDEAAELALGRPSWAPTALAALALARAGLINGLTRPLAEVLDALPLHCLSAARTHEPTLARLGCRSLGDVRALPRGGLARRFDAALLTALDQAYGLGPHSLEWVRLPEHFKQRLELMTRVEMAPALLFGARRLLIPLCGWLAARRSGTTAFTLRWCHDTMRSRSAGDGGEITVHTAEASRHLEHLSRLLAEHLAHVQLKAPVGALELEAREVHPLEEKSTSLLPDRVQDGESLALVLERIAARLSPQRVLRPVLDEDHRMEWMAHWQPADRPLPRTPRTSRTDPASAPSPSLPQPAFILPEPLRLATRGDQPMYQGPLALLSGPHRVEGGWWDRAVNAHGQPHTRNVLRDYWVAASEHAGVLWVYHTRLDPERSAWFLQGVFA